MSDTANTTTEPTEKPRRRSLPGRLVRIAAFMGLGIVLLLIALLGFTETSYFKSMLRDVIVEAADSSLNAHLTIESIDGNLFSGWSLRGVRLRDTNGPIASIDKVLLRYDLLTLLWKRITIRELTLDRPSVFITRAEGRDWNINTLLKPTGESDSAAFDWRIIVQHLRIVGGHLLVYDSSHTGPIARDRLDANRLEFRDITLALSAEYGPVFKKVSLNQFSWKNVYGDVHMKNVAGDIVLLPTGVDIQGLSVQTERSSIFITSTVDGVDLLEGIDTDAMQDYPIVLSARATDFDARDLQYFLPSLDFLGGLAAIDIRAKGSLRELTVGVVSVEAYDSHIVLSGVLRDIMLGADMWMDVKGKGVRISGTDIIRILPGIPMLDVTELGTAEFDVLHFTGHPLSFVGEVDVATDAGELVGKVAFDFTGEQMTYDGIFSTRNLDLAGVFHDPSMGSSINAEGTIQGRGTELGITEAMLKLQLDSSRYQQFAVHRLTLDATIRTDSLEMKLDLASGAGNLKLDGAMGFIADSVTGFTLTSRGTNLDLQPMLGAEEYNSDLTFHLRARGDGLDFSTMSGDLIMAIEPSRFGSIIIERDTFNVALKQSGDTTEHLLIETQYADARFNGRFDFPRFVSYLGEQADSLESAIANWVSLPDSNSTISDRTNNGRTDTNRTSINGPDTARSFGSVPDTNRTAISKVDTPRIADRPPDTNRTATSKVDTSRTVGSPPDTSSAVSRTADVRRPDTKRKVSSRTDKKPVVPSRSASKRVPEVTVPLVDRDTADFMNVNYAITLKHPDRIARYFDASTFIVRGTYDGTIVGGYNGFDIKGQARVSDFYYIDSSHTWLAAGVRFNYEVGNLRLENPLQHVSFRTVFSAGDANIDGLRLNRVEATLEYLNGRPKLHLSGNLDTMLNVELGLQGRYMDNAVELDVSLLKIAWLKEQLTNDGPARIRIDSSGISIERLGLVNGRIQFSLQGKRSFDGTNNFELFVDSLNMGVIEYAATGNNAALRGENFTGMGFIEANLTGTDDNPLIAAAIYIDSLGYRGSLFGALNMEARYFDENLELYSELNFPVPDGGNEQVFFLSGTIPVAITFGEEETESKKSANLRMQMKEFPLALIEEFLGLFSPLEGRANGDIEITGTTAKPSFKGYLAVENANGRFRFNNMDYRLNLRVEAEKQDIRIVSASIENTPKDWSEGRITAEGTISTETFTISLFDLTMRGRLKVLSNASRAATRSLYGDLFISTGGRDLTYRGRLDRSLLHGNIVIEEGALVFPFEEDAGAVSDYSDFTYVTVDDTTTQITSSLSRGRFALRQRLLLGDTTDEVEQQAREISILEGLSYDIVLSTTGRLRVEIPIPSLQAQLNAALIFNNLKVSNMGGKEGNFVGEVQLGPESDFIFLGKRMIATGSLRFIRNPQNPDLNLIALYSDYYVDPETVVRRQVYVKVIITGTKEKPELKYDMRWDHPDGALVSQGGDVQSDAFSFVMFGVFAKDLTQSGSARNSAIDRAPELAYKMGSAVISGVATEFLGKAGLRDVVNRVDFANIGTQDTRVKVTSEIGRALITYDGKVSNMASSNITADFPLDQMLGIPWLSVIIQVARKTIDQTTESATQIQEYSIYELKILKRFSF